MRWHELERAAPEIAGPGRERLELARVALLATLRRDGSPRIGAIEPYLSQGELLFGSMSWSRKTHDLVADPRCALHSAVSGPDLGEGELELHGRAVEAGQRLRDGCAQGWWQGRAPEAASVFALDVEEAVFVSWDLERGRMTVRRWSRRRGVRTSERDYP